MWTVLGTRNSLLFFLLVTCIPCSLFPLLNTIPFQYANNNFRVVPNQSPGNMKIIIYTNNFIVIVKFHIALSTS